MKCLSLWQPWAAAIAVGRKTIETRHWPTFYRGPLAIHAAKRWTGEEREFLAGLPAGERLDTELTFGAVIAVARLVDVIRTETLLARGLTDREQLWGNYGPERYGWVLADVRAITPVPFRGAQGLFEVPDVQLGLQPPPSRQPSLL